MKENRTKKILESMKAQNVAQLVISDPASIYYLTGRWILPGERLLVLLLNGDGRHKLFINELFPVDEDLGAEKIILKDTQDGVQILSDHIRKEGTVGIDKNWPSRFLIRLMELRTQTRFINGSPIVDLIRQIKDEDEIRKMRAASLINDAAVKELALLLQHEYTEKEMGAKLSEIYQKLGTTEGFSFEPIIGYGKNAADPHHMNSDDKPKKGDSVILDIGCVKDGYCSDMTRTVFYGEPSAKAREVYNIVLEAQLRGIAAVKPGATCADVDHACRDYITEKGYGQYFTHRTGHNIGIECHEYGDVSSVNTAVLKPGMIFSIEPGIYIPGEVGVRIEDLVVVTETGCENLNHCTKDLCIVAIDV